MAEIKIADRVVLFRCENEGCNLPHVLLLDENEEAIAAFQPSEEFANELTKAFMEINGRKAN